MAGKYGSASVTITYDDAPGGTGRIVTGHILTMSGAKIQSVLQASHAFGDSWEEHTPSGLMKMEPVTLTGFWDTTATTGPHVVLRPGDAATYEALKELEQSLEHYFLGEIESDTARDILMSLPAEASKAGRRVVVRDERFAPAADAALLGRLGEFANDVLLVSGGHGGLLAWRAARCGLTSGTLRHV